MNFLGFLGCEMKSLKGETRKYAWLKYRFKLKQMNNKIYGSTSRGKRSGTWLHVQRDRERERESVCGCGWMYACACVEEFKKEQLEFREEEKGLNIYVTVLLDVLISPYNRHLSHQSQNLQMHGEDLPLYCLRYMYGENECLLCPNFID